MAAVNGAASDSTTLRPPWGFSIFFFCAFVVSCMRHMLGFVCTPHAGAINTTTDCVPSTRRAHDLYCVRVTLNFPHVETCTAFCSFTLYFVSADIFFLSFVDCVTKGFLLIVKTRSCNVFRGTFRRGLDGPDPIRSSEMCHVYRIQVIVVFAQLHVCDTGWLTRGFMSSGLRVFVRLIWAPCVGFNLCLSDLGAVRVEVECAVCDGRRGRMLRCYLCRLANILD